MEIGKYIDFHNANSETKDYSIRLYTDNTGVNSVLLPNSNGRLALVSQIPDSTSDLTNDSGFITSSDLPTKTSDLTNDGSDGTSTYVEADELATVATSGLYNDLTGKPTLATVATTGAYNDLTGKPTIPTVNDATLTIQKNGTNVQTFTANQATNATANITVPTQFSDLSGTIGTSQIANTAVTNSKIDWTTVAGQPTGFTRSNIAANGFLSTFTTIADANDVKETGFYYLIGVNTNAPSSSTIYQAIVVSNSTQDYGHQIFMDVFSDDIFLRGMQGGNWGAWSAIGGGGSVNTISSTDWSALWQ